MMQGWKSALEVLGMKPPHSVGGIRPIKLKGLSLR